MIIWIKRDHFYMTLKKLAIFSGTICQNQSRKMTSWTIPNGVNGMCRY